MNDADLSESDVSDQYSQRLGACQPKWRLRVDKLGHALGSFLWPPRCVLCLMRTNRADLCAECAQDLALNSACCAQCALPLGENEELAVACGACIKKPPHFDATFAPYRYAYPLHRMIQRLKYARELNMGRVLARSFVQRLMATRCASSLPQAIVPVPLGRARYIARGYNQAIELAQHMRVQIAVPVRTNWVVRERETIEQVALARDERQTNVRGAFALACKPDCDHVAILDDVVTTGSTVNEVAKLLRKAGVARIEVWAIARAGR